ncbi:MAG: hypothetical protein WBM90_08570 [Acidimicrobiia bacterium]
MSFQEKSTWTMLVLVVGVYGWYFFTILAQVGTEDVTDIAYRGMMLVTVIVLVVLAAAIHIVLAVASPDSADKSDERDKEINRFGEYVGGYVLGTGAVIAMGMAMFEVDYFWIANVILLSLVLSEITSALTKVVLYRRGSLSW